MSAVSTRNGATRLLMLITKNSTDSAGGRLWTLLYATAVNHAEIRCTIGVANGFSLAFSSEGIKMFSRHFCGENLHSNMENFMIASN